MVCDIPAGDGKLVNLFYGVGAWRKTKENEEKSGRGLGGSGKMIAWSSRE